MLRGITDVPVIIATARDDEAEIVRLLNDGADDYLIKPFSVEHLSARMAAVLRRSRAAAGEAPPSARHPGRRARHRPAAPPGRAGRRRLDLTRREFDLLAFLAGRPGVVVAAQGTARRGLAAVVRRRPDHRRPSVLAAPEAGRDGGQAALSAHPARRRREAGAAGRTPPAGRSGPHEVGAGQGLPGGHRDGRGRLRRAARAGHQGDGPRPGLLQRRAAGRRHRPGALHHHRPRAAGAGRRLRPARTRRMAVHIPGATVRAASARPGIGTPGAADQDIATVRQAGPGLHHARCPAAPRCSSRPRSAPARSRSSRCSYPSARSATASPPPGWCSPGVGVALIVGSVAVADRLGVRMVQPAQRLAGAAHELGEGRLGRGSRRRGRPNCGSAAVAFNSMADQVVQLLANERELAADLSHRLRTPLTVLRLNAASLGDGPGRRADPGRGRAAGARGRHDHPHRPRGQAADRGGRARRGLRRLRGDPGADGRSGRRSRRTRAARCGSRAWTVRYASPSPAPNWPPRSTRCSATSSGTPRRARPSRSTSTTAATR